MNDGSAFSLDIWPGVAYCALLLFVLMYLIFNIVLKTFNNLFEKLLEMGDHNGPVLVAYIKSGRALYVSE